MHIQFTYLPATKDPALATLVIIAGQVGEVPLERRKHLKEVSAISRARAGHQLSESL